jgi:fructose-1,6-bisphosphatase II
MSPQSPFPPEIQGNKLTPPHHPGLGLVRVTEAAALAAGRWMGLGDREGADRAAQEAMAAAINLLPMKGTIVCGEERRVHSHPALQSSHKVGTGEGPEMDVELNAIDGAGLVAEGQVGAVAVAALTPGGTMWHPGAAVYMNKLVVDREVAADLGPEALEAPPGWTLALVARKKKKNMEDLVVFVVERPRHERLIEEIRRAGSRVILRRGGDVGGALLAADPDAPVDLLMGVGGAAEALISACAVKAMGGAMLCQPAPQTDEERQALLAEGQDLDRVYTCEDMVRSEHIYFSATGITGGMQLDGVTYHGNLVETHSLALRLETGTRRMIRAEHRIK